MNRIRMIADRETNFVFHMLSVARCGYDNDYGRKYRREYPEEALETLKRHEDLITCAGGRHWGGLYTPLVCVPARGGVSAKEVYREILRRAETPEPCIQSHLVGPAMEIARVMILCCDHYIDNIWPDDRKAILAHIAEVMPLFEQRGFSSRAEEKVGCAPPAGGFCASMVASVRDGAEAIDLAEREVVFGIDRSPEWAFRLIGHEYIICLLKNSLRAEDAFRDAQTWGITEGLAEYYYKEVTGESFFPGVGRYVAFFEAQREEGAFSAAELWRRARDAFGLNP